LCDLGRFKSLFVGFGLPSSLLAGSVAGFAAGDEETFVDGLVPTFGLNLPSGARAL
jgi:hypothetical protein